jgi:Phytochelatin synthase
MVMTRARKILLSIAIAVAMLVGTAAIVPPLLWGDGIDYSHVASIKTTREYQDPALLAKAWALPVAALYRSEIDFQNNGSFCGPTSVVNVMRSLRLGGDQSTVLAGTRVSTVLGFVPGGISLDQLAEIAQVKLGKKVSVLRDLDLATFREHLRLANDPSRRYIVNFTRGPLFGTASGHHSPIAGYLAEDDLVLVLDVNKKYGPWLVKPERLHEAVSVVDRSTGKKRGLLLIE